MSTSSPHVFFLIAGEASGDVLGAHIMRALKNKLNGEARFVGIGGPHMQAEGLDILFPYTELMHFGVIEVARHVPRLLQRITQTAEEVYSEHANILITIDSPDFCFRVAKKVKENAVLHIPIIHIVAPTVWAWRPGRAKKIAKFLDHLLVLFPFEPPYFTREGLPCTFIGHPLIESGASVGDATALRHKLNLSADAPLLTVLFGSRSGEFERLAPLYRSALKLLSALHPALNLVIPVVPHLKERISAEVKTWNIPAQIVEGEFDKYGAFAASTAALACSGTVALELALARLPSVTAYKINSVTAAIYRHFITTRHFNLINIMHGQEVVPEYIQENCTPQNLANGLDLLLRDKAAREEQISYLSAAASWLGDGHFIPSERAAETILKIVEKKPKAMTGRTVLQVLPALHTGGVERGTIETVAALTKAGLHAVVASSGGPMVEDVIKAGGVHVTLPLASKNPFIIRRNIKKLCELIRGHKVDLVHARSRAPAWSAASAAKKCHVPFVTTFHSAYGASNRLKRWYNSSMAQGMRIIAISDFVAAYAKKTYGIAASIIRTIPRGVDIDQFTPENVSAERLTILRKIWGITEDTRVILMPARITRWKGQSVLVQALAQLPYRNYICIIVGGGLESDYGRDLAREIKDAGLEGCVRCFTTCRDMPAAYSLADLVVAPSVRPEGFGRVVIEAQSMGAPIIATNHGGARETVIAGETGWLVEPNNASELARTIDTVLKLSPEQRRALAARCITHIRAHFTVAMMTSRTLEVYNELFTLNKCDISE